MDKKVFQPELMAREALEMVRPQAEKKGLELGLSLDPGLPANLAADDRKLLQILINLAGNAIKFTESGRVEIEMGLTPGNMLSIAVRDTGPGIPADQQERVFGAFEQAEDGLNRKYQGSGLGLAISQKLAEAMGGRIELVSEPGKGSVFTVAVPVEVKVKPVAAERCVSGGRAVPASCKGLVLIIDDEADVVEVVKRMIEHLGLSAHGVLKGRRGLEWAREHRPDVILLDLNLPDLSGWEVLEALKKDPATRSIPVLMQTVMDREDLGRSRGVSAWITKPFSIETLQKALEDAGVSVAEKAERSAQSPELDRQAVKETLLVIDDNKTNRELVRELLGDGEWEVIEAASAEEGLALMKEHRPEVVLLDIALPGMDGLSAARLIRKDPDLRDAFIIAVTAAVVGAEEDKCLAAGCDAYLRKPYSINLLLEKIARRRDSGRARNRKRGTANEQMRG
jgi:CheY-like chemotaxis protein/anti-sigma regulatory factor (Ser/Thr protein kinase)